MGQFIELTATDGGAFRGYLSLPASGRGPGVVVEQEIFGINANVRETCDMFAREGFVALAPDLFWRMELNVDLGYTEADWKRAFDFFGRFNVDKGIEDCQAAISALRKRSECTGKVGAVGYCLGGKLAYLSATRTHVDAAVGYYGVGVEAVLGEKGAIKRPLMLHFAEKDKFVPMAAIEQVKAGLSGIKDVEVFSYPNVDHAFARFNGDHYDDAAAKLANGRTLSLFRKTLG